MSVFLTVCDGKDIKSFKQIFAAEIKCDVFWLKEDFFTINSAKIDTMLIWEKIKLILVKLIKLNKNF